jgi:ParB/RepB/Spo0J family partition protein
MNTFNNPSSLTPELSHGARIVARTRLVIAKKRAQETFDEYIEENGNQAEFRTSSLYAKSDLVTVEKILDDPKFTNFRRNVDPAKISDLQTSIDLEGLRTPLTLIKAATPGYYHVRAGFRRLRAVRNLGWIEVPAIVLPADTPEREEYWANIIENTNREKLSTYEIAHAAKMMRDRFKVSGHSFAQKTGHAPEYVRQLLACIDKLPPEVQSSWSNGDKVPFIIYWRLSCMTPLEAIKNLRLWMGQHRIESSSPKDLEARADAAIQRLQEKRRVPTKLLTVPGIERTQRLMMAIKVSTKLSDRERELGKEIVEYCQGCRKKIDGVVDDHKRIRSAEFEPPERPDSDDIELLNALPALNEKMVSLKKEIEEAAISTRRSF